MNSQLFKQMIATKHFFKGSNGLRTAALGAVFVLLSFSTGVLVTRVDAAGAIGTVTQTAVGWNLNSLTARGASITPLSTPVGVTNPDGGKFELQLFTLINQHRVGQGLPPLALNKNLKESARNHSKAMGKTGGVFDTVEADGKTPQQRADKYKESTLVLEAIVGGYQTPSEALAALTVDPNTSNLLTSLDVTEMGVGYAFSNDILVYRHYWTIDFGARLGFYPLIINNGDLSTYSPNVNLFIGAGNFASEMMVSNDPKFAGAVYEPFAATKAWTLASGYGRKTVHVKLKNAAGTEKTINSVIAYFAPQKGTNPSPLVDDAFPQPFTFDPNNPNGRLMAPPPTPLPGSTATFTPLPTNTPAGPTATPARAGAPVPTATGLAPSYYQSSKFMLGKVAVGLVTLQCGGGGIHTQDTCTESWTTARLDQIYNETVAGLQFWSDVNNAKVEFVVEQQRAIPTVYEPINRTSFDDGLWINDVLGRISPTYNDPSNWENTSRYEYDLRKRYNADWSIVLYVVDSYNNASGTFPDGYFAYSYLGGPYSVFTYDNDGWGPTNFDSVVAHETGHLFNALDEYTGAGVPCTATSGYLVIQNQNSDMTPACLLDQDSIMRGGTVAFANRVIDAYAHAAVGYRISGGNGLPDPINTTPVVAFDPMPGNTTNTTPMLTGLAEDRPYSPGPGEDPMTINKIINVQWRLGGGAWNNATPIDGAWNTVSERFAFTPTLSVGCWSLGAKAINRVGNESSVATFPLCVDAPPPPTFTPTPSPTPFVPGSLCVRAFLDNSPTNGAYNAGELSLAGAVINVFKAPGYTNVVGIRTTDGTEPYCFSLTAGQYNVMLMSTPPGASLTNTNLHVVDLLAGGQSQADFGLLLPTPTPLPPTPTPLPPTPTPTSSSIPPPADTPTATSTNTPVPGTPTKTWTPTRTATASRTPTNTKTLTPTKTSTPLVWAPTRLSASAQTGYIKLTWRASSTVGATYTVYRCLSTDCTFAPIVSGFTALLYSDYAVTKGLSYKYYVVANKAGLPDSPTSNIVGPVTAK